MSVVREECDRSRYAASTHIHHAATTYIPDTIGPFIRDSHPRAIEG